MTNLVEIERWEEGVYQLETSDPVVGGPDGIDNLQAKQLANRTRFLKRAVEAGQSHFDEHVAAVDPHPQYATHADLAEKVAALVAQSPETLDTLSELAKALGNDPNFATTIANALAAKAPLDSPVFAGTPKVPALARFDNSARAVNSAFVKSVGMQASAFTTLVGATVLTEDYAGSTIYLGGSGNYAVTLPRASSVPAGVRLEFVSGIGVSPVSISRQGTDVIYMNANTSLATVPMALGDTFVIESNGANWYSVGGSTPLAYANGFSASFNTSGCQRLPSGLIVQWVTGSSDSNGNMYVTNPLAFPHAVLGGIANEASPGGWTTNTTTVWSFDLGASTVTTSVARVRNVMGAGGPGVAAGIAGRVQVWGY
ncbi:hypothetical protein [Burkholderia vietnamiensis]|uniref:gp53-like domain-containing protein n=1 Tax=Burkholderia vietnamiensis TaxID=60552 RepID=UPI000AAC7951|nr:hypothetical protein [Burkholderia vietnamiensis]HDR9148094.1 hypothetical protein [Burkholderia vietnamiensis]HDR9237808.1 hypothetical protein [Burkholderia vietnamiensis]